MRFTIATALAALVASVAATNTIEFVNQDSTTRSIIFTGNEGLEAVATTSVPGLSNVTVTIPSGWIGNFYSVSEGAANVPGMLGEVMFGGYAGANYFDISAIVDPNDTNGVKMLYPKVAQTPVSGCQTFPCSNAYNKPDDIETLSSTESDFVCLIGTLSSAVRRHARHFVTGHSQ